MVMNQLKYFAPFRTLSISSSLQAIRIFKTTLNTSDPKSDVKMLLQSSLILSTFGFARRILITYCRKRTAESGFSSLVSSEKFTRYSLIIISQFCKFVNLLGTPFEIRTRGPHFKRVVLWPAKLMAQKEVAAFQKAPPNQRNCWWNRWDSNSHCVDFNGMRYWYCPNQSLLISCPLPLPKLGYDSRFIFYKYYSIF